MYSVRPHWGVFLVTQVIRRQFNSIRVRAHTLRDANPLQLEDGSARSPVCLLTHGPGNGRMSAVWSGGFCQRPLGPRDGGAVQALHPLAVLRLSSPSVVERRALLTPPAMNEDLCVCPHSLCFLDFEAPLLGA